MSTIARTLVLLTIFGAATHELDVWVIDTTTGRVQCPPMAGVGAAHRVYEAFGIEVRKQRDKLGWTQLDLSRRIGLTRGSVANIEAGRQSVLLHQFLAIAVALKLTPEQLLPAETETPPAEETTDMPESVLDAVKAIRKSAGSRALSRR